MPTALSKEIRRLILKDPTGLGVEALYMLLEDAAWVAAVLNTGTCGHDKCFDDQILACKDYFDGAARDIKLQMQTEPEEYERSVETMESVINSAKKGA